MLFEQLGWPIQTVISTSAYIVPQRLPDSQPQRWRAVGVDFSSLWSTADEPNTLLPSPNTPGSEGWTGWARTVQDTLSRSEDTDKGLQ